MQTFDQSFENVLCFRCEFVSVFPQDLGKHATTDHAGAVPTEVVCAVCQARVPPAGFVEHSADCRLLVGSANMAGLHKNISKLSEYIHPQIS